MTTEQLKQNAAAMIAFAEGKPVEWTRLHHSDWKTCRDGTLTWNCTKYQYRPKPEPVGRPWSKPEDVPGPVCWIRVANSDAPQIGMVVGFTTQTNIIAAHIDGGKWGSLEWRSLGGIEYSTDRKTWHPCTVTEDAK